MGIFFRRDVELSYTSNVVDNDVDRNAIVSSIGQHIGKRVRGGRRFGGRKKGYYASLKEEEDQAVKRQAPDLDPHTTETHTVRQRSGSQDRLS